MRGRFLRAKLETEFWNEENDTNSGNILFNYLHKCPNENTKERAQTHSHTPNTPELSPVLSISNLTSFLGTPFSIARLVEETQKKKHLVYPSLSRQSWSIGVVTKWRQRDGLPPLNIWTFWSPEIDLWFRKSTQIMPYSLPFLLIYHYQIAKCLD